MQSAPAPEIKAAAKSLTTLINAAKDFLDKESRLPARRCTPTAKVSPLTKAKEELDDG